MNLIGGIELAKESKKESPPPPTQDMLPVWERDTSGRNSGIHPDQTQEQAVYT